MRKKIEWEWEALDDCTKRAKVIGGWVLMRLGAVDVEKGKKIQFRESLIFIPDRDHEWHVLPPVKAEEAPIKVSKADDFAPK